MKPGPYALRGLAGIVAIVAVALILVRANAGGDRLFDSNRIQATAVLSGKTQRSLSTSFEGGDAMVMMGGVDFDLREATIAGEEAVIDLFVLFGGVQIRVPEGWVVIDDVATAAAGMENRARGVPVEGAKRLVVRGTILFGGLDIRN